MEKIATLSLKEIMNKLSHHLNLFLFIPILIILYPLLPPGVMMFGDFPLLETSLHPERFLSTWIDYGSHFGFETLPRFPIIFFGHVLNNLYISSDIISKFLIVLGFSAASFSFYFSFMRLLRNSINNNVALYRICGIIGSLFYSYNVWSFHRISHWYLWLGYAILPLFLVSLYYSFRSQNKWGYTIVAVLLWSIASSTPHMTIFYGLFYLAFTAFYMISNVRNRTSLVRIVIITLAIISFYVLINLYWIYPTILYSSYAGSGNLLPSIHITKEMTEILSRDSSYVNVLRLIEDWFQPRVTEVSPPQTSILYIPWLIASFVFPIVAFSALLIKKHSKYILLFSCLAIIGIFLTLGTNEPIDLYSLLLFGLPFSSTVAYVFRDPDKWAFMIGLSYSFLLGIASVAILKKLKDLKHNHILVIGFISLILVSFVLYSYPIYIDTAQKLLDPVVIPDEYEKINQYLTTNKVEKSFFMFQDYAPTHWNKGREFCCIDQRLSVTPNIMTYLLPASQNYHDFIKNSIITNKTNDINNFIYPLGTSLFIYSNDELNQNYSLLGKLSSLKNLKNTENIGFFKLFETNQSNTGQVRIPKENIIIVGGLDSFTTLNSLPSFSSNDNSLSFLDQNLNNLEKFHLINSSDYLALSKNINDYFLSFIDDKYIIAPIDDTVHDDPSKVWSKSATGDPENANFQQVLSEMGIENWDFDYGRGLALTYGLGSNLSVPLQIGSGNITESNNDVDFQLYMRYLKNQKGGLLKIYLDGNLIKAIDTSDKISNKFTWEDIASLRLKKGNHTITLQNVVGLNAINIFALIPSDEMHKLREEWNNIPRERTSVIYPFEAESNFYNNKGKDSGLFLHLFNNNNTGPMIHTKNITIAPNVSKTYTGQFRVPPNTDLATFQFANNQGHDKENSLIVRESKIFPVENKHPVLSSDFENISTVRTVSNHFNWTNNHKNMLSTSFESNVSISDNNSLRVNIGQGNFSYWGTISTNFIPINDTGIYEYGLDISAKDVNQLHAKAYFYDSAKKEINVEFIFGGRDGTFEQRYNQYIIPPVGTKYVQLQMWVAPNPTKHSMYLLDNVKLREHVKLDWFDYHEDIVSTSFESNKPISGNNSLRVNIGQGNFSYWGTISTDFIPINDAGYYNYSLDVSAKDVNQLHAKAYFYDSSKKEIRDHYILDARNGTFEQRYNEYIIPPIGTKYVQLQMWVAPNPNKNSMYLLDNVKLEEIIPSYVSNLSYGHPENKYHQSMGINPSLNNTILVSKAIPVEQNHAYNYSLTVEGKNSGNTSIDISFGRSSDVIQNFTRYGNNASNGGILSLEAGSEVYTKLDIIKPSNYTIAIRAKTCDSCTFLRVVLEDDQPKTDKFAKTINLSLENESSGLKWISSNETYLKQGTYDLTFYAGSPTDIDSIILYENNNKVRTINDRLQNNTSNLFDELQSTPAAYISSYEKIDSTKYVVSINNASRPYILSFAEAYDPLWIAQSNNRSSVDNNNELFEASSFPLYSVVNGFLINKTGDYDITIEYQPQNWFTEAGKVSILAFVSIVVIYFISTQRRNLYKLSRTVLTWK